MTFTEEMLAEDEKKWGYCNILAELKYCGNHMRDRKIMTNQDIRFYAYIMRKAYHMLIKQERIIEYTRKSNTEWCEKNCPYAPDCGPAGVCNQVVSLLKEQEAVLVDTKVIGINEKDVEVYCCPDCRIILDPAFNYCPNCGQAVKWE